MTFHNTSPLPQVLTVYGDLKEMRFENEIPVNDFFPNIKKTHNLSLKKLQCVIFNKYYNYFNLLKGTTENVEC